MIYKYLITIMCILLLQSMIYPAASAFAQQSSDAAEGILKSGGISFSGNSRSVVSISSSNKVRISDLSSNEILSFKAHTGKILQVIYSPDSSMIATASENGEVKLWRTDGTLLAEMKGHTGAVQGLIFSPDGESLYSCSDDGSIRRWKINGNLFTAYSGHTGAVYAIALSRDGRYLYSGSKDRTVKIWNPDGSIERTISGFSGSVNCIDVRQDGMCAAGTSDRKIRLITSDGKSINDIEEKATVLSLTFLPDGKAMLAALSDGDISLREISGKLIRTFKGSGAPVYNAAVNTDGRIIAVSTAEGIQFWTSGWRLYHEVGTHDNDAYGVTVSPDQKLIASGGADNTIRIWTFDGRHYRTMKTDGAVRSLAFSPNGEYLLSSSDDRKVRLWTKGGTLKGEYEGYSYFDKSVSWNPDGKSFVYCSVNDGAEVRSLDGTVKAVLKGGGSFTSAAFSPDGRMIATGGNSLLTIWTPAGRLIRTMQCRSYIQDLAWSPDSTMIVAGAGGVELWSVDGKNLMNSGVHSSSVFTVAFSPDGRTIASGTCDQRIFISALDGTVISRMKHQSHVHSVFFSPDGKYLASNSWDRTVKLWTFNGDAVRKVEDAYLDDDYITAIVPRPSYRLPSCDTYIERSSAWYLWAPMLYMGTSAGFMEYRYKNNPSGNWLGTFNASAGGFFLGGFLWMNLYETIFVNPYSYTRGFGKNFWDTVIILSGSAACGYAGYHYSPQVKKNRALYYSSAAAVVTIPFMVYTVNF